jgi:hypothetical protein
VFVRSIARRRLPSSRPIRSLIDPLQYTWFGHATSPAVPLLDTGPRRRLGRAGSDDSASSSIAAAPIFPATSQPLLAVAKAGRLPAAKVTAVLASQSNTFGSGTRVSATASLDGFP